MASHLIIIFPSELSCILWKQELEQIFNGSNLYHNVDLHKMSITTIKNNYCFLSHKTSFNISKNINIVKITLS